MAEISWIKLNVNIFDDEKMKLIDQLPENDAVFRIWVYLLSLAGKTNDSGLVYLSNHIPYTDEMIAALCNRPIAIVRLALATFKRYGMIDIYDNEFISINNWEKHQNVDGMERVRALNAERNKKYRERKKELSLNDVSVTSRDGTDKIRIDKDKNRKDKEVDIEEQFNSYFNYFINLDNKNRNNRAMSLQEFMKLIPDQRIQAITGAKNYTQWYQESGDDTKFSKNSTSFLQEMIFTEYLEKPAVQAKRKPRRSGGMR